MMNVNSLLEQLTKTNRMYAVISNVNSMILHVKDKNQIFAEACRIAVDEGKFLMSWIGLVDDKTKTLKPIKWYGKEEGYLSSIPPISIEDIPTGRGPSGRAYREGKSVISNDFTQNLPVPSWSTEGEKRGYRSAISIPIKIRNFTIGTFNIYASEKEFFNDFEIKQLESLADNIGFALEALQNAEELAFIHSRNSSILGNMREGLHLIGFDYKYLFLNPSAVTQSQVSDKKILGKTMMECYPGIDQTEMFSKLKECMEKRIAQVYEYEHTYPDQSKKWFELRFTPVPEGLLLSSDITERRKIEEALSLANKERAEELLINASKMSALGEMASGIAHEINNPLSIIIMQVSKLLKEFQNEELSRETLKSGLKRISSTAQRIGKVVRGLSIISRNSANDPMKEINISTVIDDTFQLSFERFKNHAIELRQDISALNNTTVLGHSSLLMQVLLNLLNNAFDAVLPLDSKWVEINAFTTDTSVVIKVTDSGEGIPDHLLPKIMQPFFTTKESGKGTGLGLSISKEIISDHQGQLYYHKNSPNTCFVIELPIQKNNLSDN